MTFSEIEDLPTCRGCIYYVNYTCTNEVEEGEEPLDLMECYQVKEDLDFMSPAFEKWWIKTHGSN